MEDDHRSPSLVSTIPQSRPPSQPPPSQPNSTNIATALMRSRSNTSSSAKANRRPKSRGSTASTQSASTIFPPEQGLSMPSGNYIMHQRQPEPVYQQTPEELLASFGQQMVQPQPQGLDSTVGMHTNYNMQHPTPNTYNTQPMPSYPPHSHGFPDGLPPHNLPQSHTRQMSAHYQDFEGIENQSPAPEELDASEKNKTKKGSATSLANDNELRRLLKAYQGHTLESVANEVQREVQKTDGSGSKSEKTKQVFAMLWLQQTCRKSSASVRRDEVFSQYSHRCGTEKVPALNPASFGKLVRIIFPNVQTRRLGVRGESKYHYVELSLIPDSEDASGFGEAAASSTDSGKNEAVNGSGELAPRPHQPHRSLSLPQVPQAPTDSAEFPAPSQLAQRRNPIFGQPTLPSPTKIPTTTASPDCHPEESLTVPLKTRDLPASIKEAIQDTLPIDSSGEPYLKAKPAFYPLKSSNSDENVELPDIHSYLSQSPTTYDPSTALNLTNIYRSFCICVVQSFRFCKAKPFFQHHTAFPGTMTVPVQKLLSQPAVAPWIEECDTRMYRKMISIVSSLTTQSVPKPVFETFANIASRLVKHVIESFEKMPAHVVAAKVRPATRFVHLMKQLPRVNLAAVGTATFVDNPSTRTQMWIDLLQLTDPDQLVEQGRFAPDCVAAAKDLLRNDFKRLLNPMESEITKQYERENTAWTPFFDEVSLGPFGTGAARSFEDIPSEMKPSSILEQWTEYLQSLPKIFHGHSVRCILDHHHLFWKSILTELGAMGAHSFQAWWALENFLSAMLTWQVQAGGFLDDGSGTFLGSGGTSKPETTFTDVEPPNHLAKRKRSPADVGGEDRLSRPGTANSTAPTLQDEQSSGPFIEIDGLPDDHRHVRPVSRRTHSQPAISATPLTNKTINAIADRYKLPTLETEDGLSPVKNWRGLPSTRKSLRFRNGEADDSGLGISLASDGIELPDGPESAMKNTKDLEKGWLLNSSDPVFADGEA